MTSDSQKPGLFIIKKAQMLLGTVLLLALVWFSAQILFSVFFEGIGEPTKNDCTSEECIQARIDIWSQEHQEDLEAKIDSEKREILKEQILEEEGIVP